MEYLEELEKELTAGFPMSVAQSRARQTVDAYWKKTNKLNNARDAFLRAYMPNTFGIAFDEYQAALKTSNSRCTCCGNDSGRFSPKIPFHPLRTPKGNIVVLCRKCKPEVELFMQFFDKHFGTNLASGTE